MKNINSRPSYQENLAQAEEKIAYRQEETNKAQDAFSRAQAEYNKRWKKNENNDNADYSKMRVLDNKIDQRRLEFHRAETQLKERKQKQERLGASDEDYYNQRAIYLDTNISSRTEKHEKAKAKYEKYSQWNQDLEKNERMTQKVQEEMLVAQRKLDWLHEQKDILSIQDRDQYNYEKRYTLGEKNYKATVERITDEIVNDLDGKGKRNSFPSSRGGFGGHKELPVSELMPQEEVDEEEERLSRNDPRNKIKPELRTRKRIEKNTENNQYNSPKSFTQEGFTGEIDKVLKAEEPKQGRLYEGEVVKIDQHGNAVLSFYGGDMDGLMYNRGNTGLKVGDKKIFKFEGRSKRKGRYIFTFPPKKKKPAGPVGRSESTVTEEVENALV